MLGEYGIVLYVGAGAVSALLVGFNLPPLTEDADAGPRGAAHQASFQAEASFCRSNLPGMNCICFAEKSGFVLSEPQGDMRGWAYVDKQTLARTQGTASC